MEMNVRIEALGDSEALKIVGGFNPQPDPPGRGSLFTMPWAIRGFNPQPDPPTRLIGA